MVTPAVSATFDVAASASTVTTEPACPSLTATTISMDTLVSIEVVLRTTTAIPSTGLAEPVRAAVERALRWFTVVEHICSRFDANSELRRLADTAGTPVLASPVLFQAVQFALALAARTDGAFDPTVGRALEARGFDRHYVTGERARAAETILLGGARRAAGATYRDVHLDAARHTITLRRSLGLDLGAVAKGLAIDLAARELDPFDSFCVDAGGDLIVKGRNARGQPWRVGVQHPRDAHALAGQLTVGAGAVCTSGDYERRTPDGAQHHLVDPRTGQSAGTVASATVIAPTALAADGLATAAFVLGPVHGLRLLHQEQVDGVLVTPAGELLTTDGLRTGSAPVRTPPTRLNRRACRRAAR